MNKFFFFLLSILLTFLLYSCGANKNISWAYDPTTDFSIYKTFSWTHKNHGLDSAKHVNNKYAEATVKHDVNRELTNRGLLAQSSDADLIIDFIIAVTENDVYSIDTESEHVQNNRLLWNLNRSSHSSGPGFSRRNIKEKESTLRDDKSEEGTLIILIRDRKTNQVIWKGKYTNTFLPEEDFTTDIPTAIKKIFKHFPLVKSKSHGQKDKN